MWIAKNDEEKRSRAWRFVTATTTVIIIVIVAFFITKLFTGNPLEGIWESEYDDIGMTIGGGGNLTVEWDDLFGDTDVEVRMRYTLDKNAKTIQMKADRKALEKAVRRAGGGFTEDELAEALSVLTKTFDYSVEQNELILTEREYGEQMVFIKD